MKLYIGIFVGLLGVVLLLAGGNGSAFKAWSTFFGKGLPDKTTGANNTPAGGGLNGFTPTQPGVPGTQFQQPGGPIGGLLPGATSSSFHGTNSLNGTGLA